ncbi:MAG: alpha-1,2-fucosyltransferase [Candidatus Dadabacteria bacterium]
MIICNIKGGLGNQLFQYAAAKSLALKNNTELKLDVTSFTIDNLRDLALSHFNFTTSLATAEEIKSLLPAGTVDRVVARVKPPQMKKYYKQPYFHYDSNFFKLPSTVYLSGYFQSEKYFKPIEQIIRTNYKINEQLINNVLDLGAQFQNENSVAVHIRKGDYTNKEALEYHGILKPDYYVPAIGIMKDKLQNPRFYIFSDDPSIMATQIGIEDAEVISGRKSRTAFEDLYLMSQCKHNIIANSSFSWWAAWLNNNMSKIVIAPKQWFGIKGPRDTNDLIPKEWMQL